MKIRNIPVTAKTGFNCKVYCALLSLGFNFALGVGWDRMLTESFPKMATKNDWKRFVAQYPIGIARIVFREASNMFDKFHFEKIQPAVNRH